MSKQIVKTEEMHYFCDACGRELFNKYLLIYQYQVTNHWFGRYKEYTHYYCDKVCAHAEFDKWLDANKKEITKRLEKSRKEIIDVDKKV